MGTLFPKEQIMGGLCFVCINRLEPGVVAHLGYGKIVLGRMHSAPRQSPMDDMGDP